MRIETLSERYLTQAAALGAAHLADLRDQLPTLPERWTRAETIIPQMARAASEGRGVVALEGDDLVGYLAYALFSFKGQRTAFSPEYAHAALADRSRAIHERMYTEASRRWAEDGRALHLIAWTPNDATAQDSWLWQGFGLLGVDALRDVSPIDNVSPLVAVRRATLDDLDVCQAMSALLGEHLCAPTVFLRYSPPNGDAWYETLADAARHVALAEVDGRVVGFVKIGPANDNACTIIEDAGTASISGAYVAPEHRGKGIAAALLDDCLRWARECGYGRCAVDFESANAPAARFWTHHFTPVVYGGMRYIDLGED